MVQSYLRTVHRIFGKKRMLTGLGVISLPAVSKLLFEGVGLVSVARAYWEVISQPWFQWLCILVGMLLIGWAALALEREDREAREADAAIADEERTKTVALTTAAISELVREVSDSIEKLQTQFADATKLPALIAREHIESKAIGEFQQTLDQADAHVRTLEQKIQRLAERDGCGRANMDKTEVENYARQAENTIRAARRHALEDSDWQPGITRPPVVTNEQRDQLGNVTGRAFDPDLNAQFLAAHRHSAAVLSGEVARLRGLLTRRGAEQTARLHQIDQEARRLNGLAR